MTNAMALSQAASAARTLKRPAPASQSLSLFDSPGGEPTLDELIAGVWEGLAARAGAACPVCSECLEAEYGVHARPIAGRCPRCGTRLS